MHPPHSGVVVSWYIGFVLASSEGCSLLRAGGLLALMEAMNAIRVCTRRTYKRKERTNAFNTEG